MKNILFALLCTIGIQVYSQEWSNVTKITASDREIREYFGREVSICGNYAIVGSYNDDGNQEDKDSLKNAGSAYIFMMEDEEWTQMQKIVPSDREAWDQFGISMAISENYAIIAADKDSLYLFERDESDIWIEKQKLGASQSSGNDAIGKAIAICNDYAVFGQAGADEDENGNNYVENAGAAFIFQRDANGNWKQIQKIVASDRKEGAYFGNSVSIYNDHLLVGARSEDYNELNADSMDAAGAAYIFKKDISENWVEIQKIVASDRGEYDQFGYSVSISENSLIISAAYDDEDYAGGDTIDKAGSAYIFEKEGDTWNEKQKITAPARRNADYFGWDIAIDNDYAVVGAYWEDDDSLDQNYLINAGSAYVFQRNTGGTWEMTQKLVAPDREDNDNFGFSVSISGNNIIVGVPLEDQNSEGLDTLDNSGSAYIYTKEDEINPINLRNARLDDIMLYPNPNNGNLYIDLDKVYPVVFLIITDTKGNQLVKKQYYYTDRIIQKFDNNKGIYFVQIFSKSKEIKVFKLILK